MARREIDIEHLGVDERLELIGALWDSLTADPTQVPLPDSHRSELDRRMERMEADDHTGIPWEDVLDRIRTRLK